MLYQETERWENLEYYIKIICTKTYFFVQQHCLVTIMISSMIHLSKRKKGNEMLLSDVKLIYVVPQASYLNWFFPYFHHPDKLAKISYLVICISWSIHGFRICCLRQPWKYYENTNGEKMRTLLAGYTFIGFALLCFQTVTSCSLRCLFPIGQETKQLSCFPFKFALFNNHNNDNNKNDNIFSFTKFSKLYDPTSRNYNPKFKLHAE